MILLVLRSVGFGFSSCLEQLVSHAHSEKQYYMWGLHLNRALLVNTLIFVVQSVILCFSRPILLDLGIEDELADLALSYIYISLPGMYFKIQFEATRCYLEGQKIIGITSRIIIPCTIVHALIWYITIIDLDKGIEGVAISNTIIFSLNFVILWWYLSKKRFLLLHPNSWHFINKDAFKNWGEYIKNGWQPALLMFTDNLTFQCLVIFMAWLGKDELAAYCLVITSLKFTFILPSSLKMVAFHLVGNAITLNHQKKAMKYANISVALGLLSGISFGLIFLLLGHYVVEFMTVHISVQEKFIKLTPYLALLWVTDHTQQVEWGVLKAIGYKMYGTVTLICVMLIVGVPTSFFLGFHTKLEQVGWYIGLVVSIAIVVFLFTMNLFFFIDWTKTTREVIRQTIIGKAKNPDVYI